MSNEWLSTSVFDDKTVGEALEIIEDALCYGFEIKVENHRVYFKDTFDTNKVSS